MAKLKQGDYVIATKYSDGDPGDHFCVGFFRDMTHHGRYNIVNSDGELIRGNGFMRVMKITKEVGKMIIENFEAIERGGASVWKWVRHFKKEVNAGQPV